MTIFLLKTYYGKNHFGVGSYIQLLADSISDRSIVYVVHIHSNKYKTVYLEEGSVKHLYIPIADQTDNPFFITEKLALSIFVVLKDFFSADGDNIIHLNTPLEFNIARLKDTFDGFSIVYTIHTLLWQVFYQNDFEQFTREWYTAEQTKLKQSILTEQLLCHLAGRIICLTQAAKDLVTNQYGIDSGKVSIIHNTVNAALFKAERQKYIYKAAHGFEDRTIILYSGRLRQEKGLNFLIEALRIVHDRNIDFHLLVCGGDDYETYFKLCLPFIGKVSFTGILNREDLFSFYRLADIGVLLSTIDQNSYSLMEMMAYGIPVLVTDHDSFDHIDDQAVIKIPLIENSIINQAIFLEKITDLIANANKRAVIGARAKNNVRNKFSIAHFSAQMINLYAQTLIHK